MTTSEKKARRAEMEQMIEDTHDMVQDGQVWAWEGCGVTGRDVCSMCGLTHRWGRRGQNTGSYDEYLDARGETITLEQAARLACE